MDIKKRKKNIKDWDGEKKILMDRQIWLIGGGGRKVFIENFTSIIINPNVI